MSHAGIGRGGRSVLCEPTFPPRRLIRRDERGKLRLRLANATEPLLHWRKIDQIAEKNINEINLPFREFLLRIS
jgi:hypothetical protein